MYQFKLTIVSFIVAFVLISIHLMYQFKRKTEKKGIMPCSFQYISCISSRMKTITSDNPIPVISIHLMYQFKSTMLPLSKSFYCYFNTSHVSVQEFNKKKIHIFNTFQYISCISSSSTGFKTTPQSANFNTSHVSVQVCCFLHTLNAVSHFNTSHVSVQGETLKSH